MTTQSTPHVAAAAREISPACNTPPEAALFAAYAPLLPPEHAPRDEGLEQYQRALNLARDDLRRFVAFIEGAGRAVDDLHIAALVTGMVDDERLLAGARKAFDAGGLHAGRAHAALAAGDAPSAYLHLHLASTYHALARQLTGYSIFGLDLDVQADGGHAA